MDEDTFTLYDPWSAFHGDGHAALEITAGEGIMVDWEDDDLLNVTTIPDWYGSSYLTISNGSHEIKINITVDPINDAPFITDVVMPDNLTGAENPLVISVEAYDVEGDPLTIEWFIGKDLKNPVIVNRTFDRYVYPGQRTITVKVSDEHGANVTREFQVSMKAPPGFLDEPDNTSNKFIFWSIFGSAGLIFGIFAFWIMVKKDIRLND